MISVKVKTLRDGVLLPARQTPGAAGYDLSASLPDPGWWDLQPGEVKLVPTGIAVEIPMGYEIQVRPRSGLSSKYKIILVNSPGTIDSDYRGEVFVPLMNLGTDVFRIESGMRIAQILLAKVETIEWSTVSDLAGTDRGTGGFGSSGL